MENIKSIKNMNIDEVAKLLENWKGDNDDRGFVLMIGEGNDEDLHSNTVINGRTITVCALVANFLKQEQSLVQQARIFEKLNDLLGEVNRLKKEESKEE